MHLRPCVLLVGFVFLYTTPPVTTTLSFSSCSPLKGFNDKSLLLYYKSRDIHVLFMVMVRFHYLLASKKLIAGLYIYIYNVYLPFSFTSLLYFLVSGGFVKCNAANLIPV